MAAAEVQGREWREIYFSGRVQGVGFRYTARYLAGRCGVTGFVKNLYDGRVQLVVEGPPGEIERLLADIQDALGRYIRDIQEDRGPARGEFQEFEIRF